MGTIRPLTSLRFFAATMVFIQHLPVLQGIVPIFLGPAGVSFFFVLSGFVLTYAYRRVFRDGLLRRRDALRFWAARVARIYPLHVCTLIVAAFLIRDAEKNTPIAFLLQLGLLQTWVPYRHYTFSFNAPAWSISDEAFFYALFPLIVVAIFRLKLSFAQCVVTMCAIYAALTVLVVRSYSSAGSFEWAMFQFPPTRLVEFICGILVAEAFSKNPLKLGTWAATALEVLLPAAFLLAALLPIPAPLIGTTFTTPLAVAIVFIFALRAGYVSRLLSARPLVYLGEVSFAIYMVHYMIVREVNTALAIALTLAVAIFAHELIEKPAQRFLLRLFDGRNASQTKPKNLERDGLGSVGS